MFAGIKNLGKSCLSFLRDAGAEAMGKAWVEETIKRMNLDPREEVYGSIQDLNLGPGSRSNLWKRIELAVKEHRDNSLMMQLAKTPTDKRAKRYREYNQMEDEEFWTAIESIKHDPVLQPVLWVSHHVVKEGKEVMAWLKEKYPDAVQTAKEVVEDLNAWAEADLLRVTQQADEAERSACEFLEAQRVQRAERRAKRPGQIKRLLLLLVDCFVPRR